VKAPVGVAVVGRSGRSADLPRIFDELPQTSLRWICDEGLPRMLRSDGERPMYTGDLGDVLEDEEVDVVAFASTALAAHGRALAALESDKHVFVVGPLAFDPAAVATLVGVARDRGRRLWSHLPRVERPGARRLRELVTGGALGELFYLHACHYADPGDETADLLWGPGLETVALVLDLVVDEPIEVHARAETYRGGALPDVIFGELRFATGISAHLHFSSLDGEAVDRFCVVGSDGTAVLRPAPDGRELVVHPSGTGAMPTGSISLQPGSTIAYRLPQDNATWEACARFVATVRAPGDAGNTREATAAVEVVKALERSSERDGAAQAIASGELFGSLNVVELRQR
jgi:predicted dehydrogenase